MRASTILACRALTGVCARISSPPFLGSFHRRKSFVKEIMFNNAATQTFKSISPCAPCFLLRCA